MTKHFWETSHKQNITVLYTLFCIAFFTLCQLQCTNTDTDHLQIQQGSKIVLIGNNLCSRMMNYGHFETELQLRYPDSMLFIRNMCDGGDTPGFRPHSGRVSPWAFPGAEQFQTELARNSDSQGHFESPEEWLTRLQADIIIACFGYNESFEGSAGLDNFKAELEAFILHTLSQKYNGKTVPQLAIISPIAFQNLSDKYDLPNGKKENENLALYTEAMREVTLRNNVLFVDAFNPSQKWYTKGKELTIDGSQLNDAGYQKFAMLLADGVFGKSKPKAEQHRQLVKEAVLEKNWFWHNDYKIPNGVHVFGRRYEPFGSDNYPSELKKIREMTAVRDTAIWKALHGEKMDLAIADAKTSVLPAVESNYKIGDYGRGLPTYLYGQDALNNLHVPEGYKIELFASEQEFPDLAKPVQLSFDDKGRLWVAVMPTYPHYRPGDPKPNDKLIILEDTNNDGKADKQITFADNLHIPVGFEFAPEGVYVSQGTNLKLLTDTDGDDKADQEEIILSGFDDHDTHHVISAFCADPSGAIYMGEGVFLHSNIETSYGPVRATNGGFMRYNPQRHHLERTAQLAIPNPWGIAFDEWGQNIFAETSGPDVRWMMPGSIKPRYGVATHKSFNLIEEEHKVRPTSGLEFVYSRHFPDEVQGDFIISNSIGFLGTKQHKLEDDGTGYKCTFRQDLISSDDKNFRPVDMEFAPDGSLYVIDWHNVLVGHMQHNARDPFRDHLHGRIYRITYPARPLVTPAKVYAASITELLDNLKLPEYRTRYRSRRALRAKPTQDVLKGLSAWTEKLDKNDPRYEHHLLEALWVTWGLNKIDEALLVRLMKAEDFRVRAAAVRVLRYTGHQIKTQTALLQQAAADAHGRVRLEAIVAASWLAADDGLSVLAVAAKHPLDQWMIPAYQTAEAHLQGRELEVEKEETPPTHLTGNDLASYKQGKAIFEREGYCGTCHQSSGKGLAASGFPPLAGGTPWVLGSEERLIKLTLNGLYGPIEVLGQKYPGQVPMTAFGKLLKDEEIAAVLTYVRNAFGNKASVIKPATVKKVREATKEKSGFYVPDDLLKEHPLEKVLN
jgi:mono/diheme cytochrome c family protein/glucose/arabinose dehydrogenase